MLRFVLSVSLCCSLCCCILALPLDKQQADSSSGKGDASKVGQLAKQDGVKNVHEAKESGRTEAAKSESVKSASVAGKDRDDTGALKTEEVGHKDGGSRKVEGSLSFGRSTTFQNSARDAQYSLDVDGSGAGVSNADVAGNKVGKQGVQKARTEASRGGAQRNEKSVANLDDVKKIVLGKSDVRRRFEDWDSKELAFLFL